MEVPSVLCYWRVEFFTKENAVARIEFFTTTSSDLAELQLKIDAVSKYPEFVGLIPGRVTHLGATYNV